jgi:hypothetical protein
MVRHPIHGQTNVAGLPQGTKLESETQYPTDKLTKKSMEFSPREP